MIQVTKICESGDLELAKERAIDDLKEKMWREVWKDEIDLPGVEVSVKRMGNGLYAVTAKA